MKVVLALCLLGLANAAIIPLTYNTAPVLPYNSGFVPYTAGVLPYNPGGFFPYTAGVLPYNRATVPLTYAASPAITYTSVVAPPTPGYVAKTLGSEHYAPLPAGLGYASHHINLAKAPGTA